MKIQHIVTRNMTGLFAVILFFVFILSGCNGKSDNITFTAEIESVSEKSIMVVTDDPVGFDKAAVGYAKDLELDFEPEVGQIVSITILPEIRESYPVQVTAVKIETAKIEYRKITAEEAKKRIDGGNVIILDVRTQAEYDEGHIQGAILLPDNEIKDKAESVLPDKNATILVYCRTGRRSALASEELIRMGYTDIYDFGGIVDWPYEIVR